MNILVTGASRGIGATAYALAKSPAIDVVGHSTRGGGGLIAADLADPGAPRDIWDAALDGLGGRIDVLVNNAGIFEGVADDAPDDEWHAAWDADADDQPAGRRRSLPPRRRPFPRRGGGGRIVNVASRAAYRGDSAPALALCRVQGGHGRHDQDHRPRLCGRGHPRLRRRPGFTVSGMTEEYLAGPRRRGDRRRHSAWAGSPRTDEVAETIRWLAIDAPASATGAVIDVNGASYVR